MNPLALLTVDDLWNHSIECEPTGKVTIDYLFYHSTECELPGLVTVGDLFHFHNSNLVAAFNPVSVEPLTQIDHHFTYEIL